MGSASHALASASRFPTHSLEWSNATRVMALPQIWSLSNDKEKKMVAVGIEMERWRKWQQATEMTKCGKNDKMQQKQWQGGDGDGFGLWPPTGNDNNRIWRQTTDDGGIRLQPLNGNNSNNNQNSDREQRRLWGFRPPVANNSNGIQPWHWQQQIGNMAMAAQHDGWQWVGSLVALQQATSGFWWISG